MSTQSDLECKVYVPSQVRTRLESNSSQYVTLRETAKLQRRASKPNKNVKRSNQRYKERKAFKRSAKETESAIPLNSVNSHKETKNDEASRRSGCSKELCVHRALQFLVFLFSTAALTIVILMVFGFVGQYRCGPCRIKGASQNPQKLTSEEPQDETPQTFQLNLSPLHDVVEDLERNLTALKAEAMAMMRESEESTASLLAVKKKFNSSEDAITLFLARVLANLTQINENFEQQFDPDQSAVFAELRVVNDSTTKQLVELEQTSEQENDIIHRRVKTMNDTITDEVVVKISQPGPIGERGQNGSRGPVGDPGMVGSKGPNGSKGIMGPRGLKGDPGQNGTSGSPGTKGLTGDKGETGEKGDRGDDGDLGPPGSPGPQGIGNFSWCQWRRTADIIPGNQAKVQDSANVKIVAAHCSTDSAQEKNLQVTSAPNGYEYKCVCMGAPTGTPTCILTYWECPIQAP